jgi:peptidoglycan/LPS O-acetylase OafA/YrhL
VNTPACKQPPRFLHFFRRVTSSGDFIAEVDGLRFIAIFTVVMFHLAVGLSIKSPEHFARPDGSLLGLVAWNGFRGVELFFVISGFILALPFAGHLLKGRAPVDLRRYFIRRVTRLEPPYVLAMLLLFVLHVLVRDRSAQLLWPHLTAGLVYVHNLVFGTENPINNVTWSLEIEIQFYLLTPLLTLLFAIKGRLLRRGTIAGLCLVSGWLLIEPETRAYLSIARFLHFFLVGYLLADVYLTDWGERPDRGWAWDLVSFFGWALVLAVFSLGGSPQAGHAPLREPLVVSLLFPGATFLLFCAAFRGPITNRLLTNPWIATIGGMCYSIYLLHNPALAMINSITKGIAPFGSYAANLLVQLALAAPLLLIASAGYFALIEKPCMRRDWPQRLFEWLLPSRPAADTPDHE